MTYKLNNKGNNMTCKLNEGRVAGYLYLLMIPLAVFGILYVPATLIVPSDAIATAANVLDNEGIFRLSIVSALLVQIVQIFVVLALYKIFKDVNKEGATLMAVFILIGVPIIMLNELNHLVILLLLNGTITPDVFTSKQIPALVGLLFDAHKWGVNINSVFMGLWLLPMGYLIIKSGFIPKILGILIIVAGFGYLIDFVILFLFPNVNLVLSEFTFLGEVLFPLWLVIKGVDLEKVLSKKVV